MAKIGSLEVGTIKIANGAITTFYSVTGSGSTGRDLTVTTASDNPTLIFVWGQTPSTSDHLSVTRTRDSFLLGIIGPGVPPNGDVRSFVVDPTPQDGDVYRLAGYTSGSYHEMGAIVKWR